MAKPDYEALISFLTDRFDGSLRWVASFDSTRFTYNVRYIREDLKTDLSGLEFDTIVHRSMAVFNRRHVEDVYFHLGDARSLLVDHERAMAVHLYLDDRRGVVVKIESGPSVSMPEFREACLERLVP
ncbi:MAG TPA: hypothetical protein VKA37_09845 [Halobacteriales archaeon]|nr:hypothetical protein [Halobacteriales archaeon]